jgi:branched-chain amino acid transport system substrate-binding protein
MKEHFVTECALRGINVVRVYGVSPEEDDFRTIITQMKNLNIDGVYGAFAFYPSQGQFSVQRKELGLGIPLYSTSGSENPELLEAFPAIEGTIYPYPKRSAKEEDFWRRYEERFGVVPAPSVAYAYDAVYVVAEALEQGDDIATYLEGISYDGVSNTIVFEDGRVVQKEHVMKKVKDREFVVI